MSNETKQRWRQKNFCILFYNRKNTSTMENHYKWNYSCWNKVAFSWNTFSHFFHSSNFFAFVFSFISSFFSPVLSLLFAFCFITISLFSIECHHNCSALCRCEFCGCCLLFSKLLYMCSSLLFLLCMTMSVQFSCSFYESQLSRAPTHDGDDDDMGNVCILKQAIKKTKKM